MGGISVLIGMGFLLAIILIFIVIGIFVVISYIFESIAIYNFYKKEDGKKSLTCFIPCYNKYLYGLIGDNKTIGIILSISSFVKLISFILWFFLNNSPAFWIFILFLVINFILNAVISSKIYKKYSKYDVIFTILSIVTLGILRPIFLFALRNKEKIAT